MVTVYLNKMKFITYLKWFCHKIQYMMWSLVVGVCSKNIKIDSPRLHASVTKGRRLKFSPLFTWIEKATS